MNIQQLESFIFEKMASSRLPGLSIALVKGDEVVYSRAFGMANLEKATAATTQTLYGAASITKSFVAIAIMQLVEKGLLNVTDPVEKYIPFPVKMKETIRLEHLLSHTTGLPALAYIEAVLRHAHGIGGCSLPIGGPQDVLTFMQGAEDWVETAPGERWFYLNEGYVILGEIVKKVTGQPYEKYVQENILKPLGMTRSFFSREDVERDGSIATPYVLPKNNKDPRPGKYLYNAIFGDAALITNVLDLAKYVSMFLRRGKGVLSESSYAAMTQPRIPMPGEPMPELFGGEKGSAEGAHYGYGLSMNENFFGEPIIGHGGSVLVSTSNFSFLPKSNVGVAVMTNGNGYNMPMLSRVALAIMLGHDPEKLTFVRITKAMKDLTGFYEAYRGTLKTKVTRSGDFLRMEYLCGDQSPGTVTFVPERLDGPEPKFFTYADGARLPVQFRHKDGTVELVYERYKFKRTGPLV